MLFTSLTSRNAIMGVGGGDFRACAVGIGPPAGRVGQVSAGGEGLVSGCLFEVGRLFLYVKTSWERRRI